MSLEVNLIVSRSQFSNFSITNILGEEEGENGIDGNGEIISRIKQEKIDILGIPTTWIYKLDLHSNWRELEWSWNELDDGQVYLEWTWGGHEIFMKGAPFGVKH